MPTPQNGETHLFECFDCFMELALKRVNAGVLKAPFLVLRFPYYTWLAFLIMVSVILLYIRVILLSTLSVIERLICGNSWSWILNLSLTHETFWTGVGSGLLISMLKKFNLRKFNAWIYLTVRITVVLLLW